MALIKGANAPLIRQTIMNELQQEKDVLNGLAERNIVIIKQYISLISLTYEPIVV